MRVSVVIPSHNRSGMLRQAIDSVLRQEISPAEVIVCDDGSDEDLSAVCESFADHDVRVIRSGTRECHGAQVARNRGMAMAKGNIVLFLDSDDVFADAGLGSLIRALENQPELDYAYGKVLLTDVELQPLTPTSSVGMPFVPNPVEVAGYHWHTMGAAYRRSFLSKVGPWNEALTGSQDWEYQARVKIAGGRGLYVDELVGFWRQHGGQRVGATQFRPDYVRSVMRACESILSKARDINHCDSTLEIRLAKRLFIHALEWGSNGYPRERKACMKQAADCLTKKFFLRKLIILLSKSPMKLDEKLWRALIRV